VRVPVRHTLDQLEVLEAIARTGSFAAAARELHRVPSAVSYAVAQLEDAMGVALFDRGGHKAVLTDAGRRILASGEPILAAARRLDTLATALSGGWEPTLHVVVDGALPLGPLARALRAFAALALPTRVRVDTEYQAGTVEAFVREGADLVLALDLEGAGAVRGEPLPPLGMTLLARDDHPLVRGGPLARQDLSAHVELVVQDSARRFADAPREPWFGTAHALYLSDFHAKRTLLLEGVGFGWMPDPLVREDLAAGRLAPLPLEEGARWTYRPQVAHRAGTPLGPAGQRLFAMIRDSFCNLDGDVHESTLSSKRHLADT
jgi:molybdate transport repressor ModE-like protein